MAYVHGKNTIITVNSNDLTQWTKTSSMERSQDKHDVTGGGANNHAYYTGLGDGTFSMSGTYDSTASTGPRATLLGVLGVGTSTTVIRKPEGTGTGKPQESFTAIISKYTETNPVADMITWACDMQISGSISTTTQA